MVNENVSLVISRQLLTDFCNHLLQLEDSVAKQVAHFTLEKVQARVISFEEQVRVIQLMAVLQEQTFWIYLRPKIPSVCE